MSTANMDRRSFLIRSAAIGGGLIIGLRLPFETAQAADAVPEVNAWVVIWPDDTVVVRIARSEIGQGTLTGLAQLVAEELECDWSKVTTEFPTPGQNVARNRVWRDFATGGSRESLLRLQRAGHGQRHLLLLMDRRQRLRRDRVGPPRSRVSSRAVALILAAALPALAGEIPPQRRVPGYAQMGWDLRAMQDDAPANPAMLWLAEGETPWKAKAGGAARSCADCHGESGAAMKGVAARHPVMDLESGRPRNVEQSINLCRTKRQRAAPLDNESRELLALTAFVASQSRGMPIAVEETARSRPFIEAGREIFELRLGQINIACAQCHDDNWGRRLAGSVIPQGHPTGYPLYRLEWQGLGSLHRRLRGCMAGVRAQPFDYGSPELVNLELFLMWRARGMALETPAVRP